MSDDVSALIARAEAALEGITGGPWVFRVFIAAARTLVPELAAELKATRAQLEHRRVDTVEQLKSLNPRPDLPYDGVLIKCFGCPAFGGVFELNNDGTWNDFDGVEPGHDRVLPEDIPLPAVVIWDPEWS
ncbi:hypothetical protein MM1218R_01486 [Mycobacterium marinum]|uniref:hypothetical protein n=1 Tax=Mycobacterium marinum TaxID=1781 RepID=UPI000E28AA99|nr:hypothetical protein [Mycobacterium marinum]AXN43434.1 hypothetical protein MM1218R_01486 [Mycobacterium marinum]RFZ11514.1 hypothetical protein DE4381_01102 [Mycobacterium marinum]